MLEKPDFRILYRFFREDEGGRKSLPLQGYRSDWTYLNGETSQLYMIWPRFLDQEENELCSYQMIEMSGLANMYIISDKLINSVHKDKVKVGTRGFLMEGPKKVAEAEIIEVINLQKRVKR